MYTVEPTKRCRGCETNKPLSEFYARRRITGARPSRGAFGREARCKGCKAEERKPGIHAERRNKTNLAARGLKCCTVCKTLLPIVNFSVCRASNDGRAYRCAECNKVNNRRWREKNPNAFRRWQEANREHRTEYFREWSGLNAERRAADLAAWSKANRPRRNATVAKRIAAKHRATVAWADNDAIMAIYAEAARLTVETGVCHEVDHYYPLQGELVCGLHCEANLQILTKTENIRKLNRMPVEVAA